MTFIRQLLYDLKRDFGRKIGFYRITSSVNTVETANRVVTREMYSLKAIVIPQSYITSKVYALSYIAANKNFTYGAFFNRDIKVVLIQKADLRIAGLIDEPKPDDYLVVNEKRFEIKDIHNMDADSGYIITAVAVDGIPRDAIHDLNVYQRFAMRHRAEYTLNA